MRDRGALDKVSDFNQLKETLNRLSLQVKECRQLLTQLEKKVSKHASTHRLNTFPLRKQLPLQKKFLRETKKDINKLESDHYLTRLTKKEKVAHKRLKEAALAAKQQAEAAATQKKHPKPPSLNLFPLNRRTQKKTQQDESSCDQPGYYRTRFRF
ncbi:MAG: hypothetical protein COY58_02895 [Gammaproteobacteria bacterium CG_4_10_14_0_8_um_filter_38_16]|nr:MAG: hypothetical protein COY58_02895 [Gammaproteobacteria bacterium CG_4_10_14_0_8_um_filter_38_16]PJA03875.1 MAG: hypothetical protein COX72_03055 [Gammaproteobacteria bacterium CG_4_10_14_0_2_um_filter_38_22]PJB09511.1 MAG: hypothetical protein CO120_09750 [Gammaproteobacteria bacterium CG_4_9_14_3_um_filter_38_9]